MTGTLLWIMTSAPMTAVSGCLVVRRPRVCEALNVLASAVVLVASVALLATGDGVRRTYLGDYIVFDRLGAWTLLCTALVYFLASLYAVGYMRMLNEERRLYRFYALFAGFALTMLLGPLMNNVGVFWIAIEATTLVSTFLVGFERGRDSIEAAWKYIIIVSAGISLALLGTMLFYWGGSIALGPTYDMTWNVLRDVAPQVDPRLLLMAFLLVLIGYGAKVGLAPMHTWLPDAHSEGPAPVSAMLSGALLNTAMLGIARFVSVVDGAMLGRTPRAVLIVLGILSLVIASLFIVRQEGVKRLMAYSSVEHMGVLALGFGFGGPLGVAGALYHMLNHSLNKSLMFFGAGIAMRSYRTKDMSAIRGILSRLPVTAGLWLAGAVAITGAPPFALFQSEVAVLRAGVRTSNVWAVVVMALLLIVIFVGFLNHFRRMYFDDSASGPSDARVSRWCTLPMWLAAGPLLVLGIWWPQWFWDYFMMAAAELAGAPT